MLSTVLKRFEEPDEIRIFENGSLVELTPGSLFYIPPTLHDSWVVGTERYVSLHFLGAEHYSVRRAT